MDDKVDVVFVDVYVECCGCDNDIVFRFVVDLVCQSFFFCGCCEFCMKGMSVNICVMQGCCKRFVFILGDGVDDVWYVIEVFIS